MTNALYDRIAAIESFAADVSHELKNPLTSLRSAVETLPLARNEHSRKRLLDVILHDVRRMDRLISDISDASRLDAELARQDGATVDMRTLLTDLVDIARQVRAGSKVVAIDLKVDGKAGDKSKFTIVGHDLRLGQVVTNLIENARSFVPETGGRITVRLARHRGSVRVLSRTMVPAFVQRLSSGCLSGFTPIAPMARILARTPVSACPSAVRSSRRMAEP
jgi:two-component system sensor histidine kinase ChvG